MRIFRIALEPSKERWTKERGTETGPDGVFDTIKDFLSFIDSHGMTKGIPRVDIMSAVVFAREPGPGKCWVGKRRVDSFPNPPIHLHVYVKAARDSDGGALGAAGGGTGEGGPKFIELDYLCLPSYRVVVCAIC